MTKREKIAKNAIDTFKHWYRGRTLEDVYKSHSVAKQNAYDYCKRLQEKYNGYDFRIISANTFIFTAGFKFVDVETGVIKFMHITPSYDTIVDYL